MWQIWHGVVELLNRSQQNIVTDLMGHLVKEGDDVLVDHGAADSRVRVQVPLVGLNRHSAVPDWPLVLVAGNLDGFILGS